MAEGGGQRVFVVGGGRVATALSRLLASSGVPLGGWARSQGPLPRDLGQATTLVLAVSDGAVGPVALAFEREGLLDGLSVVLHCSGSRPAAEALAGVKGIARGTFHPLVAIASGGQGVRVIPGAWVALEGDPAAIAVGQQLARAMGARTMRLAGEQLALYHAAAVIASNHSVALWDAARELLGEVGLNGREALDALLPLLRSTLDNVAAVGLPDALTGPVRRGDVETVSRHLAALGARPASLALYKAGTRAALDAAGRCSEPPPEEVTRAIVRAIDD